VADPRRTPGPNGSWASRLHLFRRGPAPDTAARPETAESHRPSAYERRTQRTLAAQGPLQTAIRRFHVPRTPLVWLAIFGPGLIAANAGNDAGGIATYASAGAAYGYSLLWVLVIITCSLAVVQEMCARMGAVTGKGFSDLIREQFGIRWTLAATAALFVANAGTAFSEFIGIAAAMELFHVSRYIAVPIAAVVLWLVVVRGSYKAVERVFLAMTVVFFAYPISALLGHPNWIAVAKGTLIPTLRANPDYLKVLVALIGTTITPYMQVYVQSSVAEKGITPRDYSLERADVYVGTLFANLISLFIIVATGATLYLHGTGVQITSADQAAKALEPLAGSGATVLFAVGLLGASLLAGAVLPLTTAYSVAEAFGFEKGVSMGFSEAPVFMGIFTGLIGVGALIALIPGLPLFQVLLVIQVVNGLLLPVVLIAALRLTNDVELMGEYRNGRVFNVIATATTIFVIALSSLLLLSTVLQPFGVSFGS
jgi:NRAMP (natural resistance-associated macrophage protein)-like metal ion transporter